MIIEDTPVTCLSQLRQDYARVFGETDAAPAAIPANARKVSTPYGWIVYSLFGNIAHLWWGGIADRTIPGSGGFHGLQLFEEHVRASFPEVTQLQFYTKQHNIPMQILALKSGYCIWGVEVIQGLQLKFVKLIEECSSNANQ